jgi:hypothetical protein
MKKLKKSSIAQTGGAPVAGPTEAAEPVYQLDKLALDVHAGNLMVVRRVDGAKPQPPQKMTTERFLDWAAKQKAQAREVIDLRRTDTPSEKRSSGRYREACGEEGFSGLAVTAID